jgi:hypothetical protein
LRKNIYIINVADHVTPCCSTHSRGTLPRDKRVVLLMDTTNRQGQGHKQACMHVLTSLHAYCHASDDKHMHMPQVRGSVSGCIHVSTPHKPCKWVGRLHKSAAAVGCTAAAVGCTAAAELVAGQCMAVRRHASGCNASVVKL